MPRMMFNPTAASARITARVTSDIETLAQFAQWGDEVVERELLVNGDPRHPATWEEYAEQQRLILDGLYLEQHLTRSKMPGR